MYEELVQAFETKGERSAMAGIKDFPETLFWTTVSSGGHSKFVLYEFPLGSQYRADFVVVWSCSGKWEITFIECENTDDKLINKNGTPTQRLNQAISQLGDWRHYIANNKLQVQQDLAKWCATKDILGFTSGKFVVNDSGQYLSDMDTVVDFKFKVIMGRRNTYSPEARRKIAQLESTSGFSFSTYDRLLSSALEHDKHENDRMARVNLGAPNCV
ncbi:hypothetical protein AL552_08675 (plasmid) [Vibrio diabolicus]|uniref:Shedu anti-phage system protein SduA domain-containing protein n=1 Tax=Vibrio harveyi group TaxID=717610 RepID=UPI000CE9A1D2|nr:MULTISPECIES: Shedu anti-phage system protein SduA domain-containing protein [Vibrio harveyi group]EGQ9040343.1 DUF4263 domain-containing protein [Vibrio parahaemolyticus]AVF93871.1 hypothetical protein AL552_08675 [Vibrio diabolicus]MCR9565876.1 DUF4263 domain-containing protein [Vibrio alginolyticus]MCS0153578.1 DUF4263 domain-containing protein [Vibrio alginolyticus]MCS0407209.1 DUF4263 domain-containing protein [Vibrio diabolicus]